MRPEDRLQSRCRMLLDGYLSPPCYWTSIAHERKQTPVQGAHQKARGVKAGLPDIAILAPGYFLGVELKAGTNKPTPIQAAFGQAMVALGHGYTVARSVEALGEAVEAAGIPLAAGWRIAAQRHDAALDAPVKPRRRGAPRLPAEKPSLARIARGNRMALVGVRG